MKKMMFVVALLMVCTLAASAVPKPSHYNFSFDGFCDGMSLVLYSPGVGIPKIFVAGVSNGCTSHPLGGFKLAIPKTIPPYVTPALEVSVGGSYPYSMIYLIQPKGLTAGATSCNWANYYDQDGTGNYLLHYGTCSMTAAPDKQATKSSGSIQ
jgi:hypothetical protein